MFDVCFRILPRLLFWSRLTPILVLLVAGVLLLVRYLDPEPSQANVEQAFNGFKISNIEFPVGTMRGITDIHKGDCVSVAEAAGYLCTLSYISQYLPSSAPQRVTKVHRLFPAEGGAVGAPSLEQGRQALCRRGAGTAGGAPVRAAAGLYRCIGTDRLHAGFCFATLGLECTGHA